MTFEDSKQRTNEAIAVLRAQFPVEHFKNAKVLDIGCGTGNGVLAAIHYGASIAVGIDRDKNEFGETHFEAVAATQGIDISRGLLIQGDIFATSFFDGGFDVILMFDSIEHVPSPRDFISYMSANLKPGGLGFIKTCPLYYSPVGHHLWQHFPEDEAPWVHLYKDWEQRLTNAKVNQWGVQRFRELNKVTRSQVLEILRENGCNIIKDSSYFHPRFPSLLSRFEHLIDMRNVPLEEDLLCDSLTIVFAKRL